MIGIPAALLILKSKPQRAFDFVPSQARSD